MEEAKVEAKVEETEEPYVEVKSGSLATVLGKDKSKSFKKKPEEPIVAKKTQKSIFEEEDDEETSTPAPATKV